MQQSKVILVFTIHYIIVFFSFFNSGHAQHLHELTQNNFDSVVNGSRFVFVIFYASWDVKSVKAVKTLQVAMDKLKDNEEHIILAKVNAYDEIKLATRFWIDHWPMFKFFIKGSVTPETYRGAVRTDDLVSFIKVTCQIQADPTMYLRSVIELDSSNFERVIHDKKKNVFVLFYAHWCEDCKFLSETFTKVGENFKNEKDCVIAKIDSDVNYAVTLHQQITHYPTLKVYSRKNKDGYIYYPGKYQENWSEENITKFLNLQCNTKRTVKGQLDETAGRVEEFDKLVRRFMEQSFKRSDVLKEAEIMKSTHTNGSSVEIYLKTMQKILQDGAAFLAVELDRIERLLQAAIHPDKSDELQKRRNILQQFAALHHEKDEL